MDVGATEVRNAPDRMRYELLLDGRVVGIADYRITDDGVVVFPQTVIDAPLRGQGLGARLVRAALDDVRAAGQRVVPACWYVAQFVDENPDYRDLSFEAEPEVRPRACGAPADTAKPDRPPH